MLSIPNDIDDFVKDIIEHPVELFKKELPLTIELLEKLVQLFIAKESESKMLVTLDGEYNNCLVIGDIHGNQDTILKLIRHFKQERVKSMVFTGDYVDRGDHSLQVLILLLSLKVTYPDKITILRGNHEDLTMNKKYGFIDDLESYYGKEQLEKVEEVIDLAYNFMSIAAITPAGSMCVHGGLPESVESIQEMADVKKPYFNLLMMEDRERMHKILDTMWQLMWNDPREEQDEDFGPSPRSRKAYLFNENATNNFLEASRCKRLIRAHEASRGGYQSIFNGKILHIFSSEPYFGRIKRASIIHELNGTVHVKTLDLNDY